MSPGPQRPNEIPAFFGFDIWGIFTLPDCSKPELKERVASLVRQLLAKRSVDRLVDDDDDLTESGLSSLDLVTLMLGAETEFDIKIPDADMTPANFRSIARITALIGALTKDARASVA
jgi:acyl carrier protein